MRPNGKAPAEAPAGASMTISKVGHPTPRTWQVQLLAARFALPLEVAGTIAALALGCAQ